MWMTGRGTRYTGITRGTPNRSCGSGRWVLTSCTYFNNAFNPCRGFFHCKVSFYLMFLCISQSDIDKGQVKKNTQKLKKFWYNCKLYFYFSLWGKLTTRRRFVYYSLSLELVDSQLGVLQNWWVCIHVHEIVFNLLFFERKIFKQYHHKPVNFKQLEILVLQYIYN